MAKKASGKKSPSFQLKNHRFFALAVNGTLFFVNFLFFYFIWVVVFPASQGMSRVVTCWILGYLFTWLVVHFTKGLDRILVTLCFAGLLAFVLLSR